MDVAVAANDGMLAAPTRLLLQRMLCPLTGLSQEIGFVMRSSLEPRLAVAGGEMTGVHVLRGASAPRRGAHHIGGTGTSYNEAMIRTLGETIERYAHFSRFGDGSIVIREASAAQLRAAGEPAVACHGLRMFSDAQLARPGFPFAHADDDTDIGWLQALSLPAGLPCWVPAQQAALGYRGGPGEPRFAEGVTTGTAAHTDLGAAMRNALLELVQIDAAMGHWYAAGEAPLLRTGRRTAALDRLIARHTGRDGSPPAFHWLRSADLPGFAVAAVFSGPEPPRCAVGLGCDLSLVRAMYKAFLEAVAVSQLAKVILVRRTLDRGLGAEAAFDPAASYDLDSNVGHYAADDPVTVLERFATGDVVDVHTAPPDVERGVGGDVRYLVEAFATAGHRLACLELTTEDVRELGFRVVRVWSPDVLTLSLPSAPPALHPRFDAYGGYAREIAHPYP